MNERWWCVDCRMPVALNIYGRCERCDSDAVDSMERFGLRKKEESAPVLVSEQIPQYAGTI